MVIFSRSITLNVRSRAAASLISLTSLPRGLLLPLVGDAPPKPFKKPLPAARDAAFSLLLKHLLFCFRYNQPQMKSLQPLTVCTC
jgi:hypothetical protein